MPRKPVSRRRSSTSAKSKIQSVKTSLLKRLRNYVILSAVMMFLGGAANGYKENI